MELPGAKARCEDTRPSILLILFSFDGPIFRLSTESIRTPKNSRCIYFSVRL